MKRLDGTVSVSGQIAPADVSGLAAAGIALIVNNRPDGEAPGQPDGAEIAAAAAAAGIGYRAIPVRQLTPEAIEETVAALGAADGQVLAYCASGTRSTFLWALARSAQGGDGDDLVARAAAAGYDLTPIRRFLR